MTTRGAKKRPALRYTGCALAPRLQALSFRERSLFFFPVTSCCGHGPLTDSGAGVFSLLPCGQKTRLCLFAHPESLSSLCVPQPHVIKSYIGAHSCFPTLPPSTKRLLLSPHVAPRSTSNIYGPLQNVFRCQWLRLLPFRLRSSWHSWMRQLKRQEVVFFYLGEGKKEKGKKHSL